MTAEHSLTPHRIDDYLAQLRQALEGADPAMIQDALSDAEEHLRAECAARSTENEETVLRTITGSYGSPADVAAAYRDTERTVQAALSPTRRPATGAAAVADAAATRPGPMRRFFSAWSDTRSWTSLVFMLVTLVTGIFYFTVVVTGVSLSLGLAILIIGVPFFVAFIGFTRVLALVEGRLIEGLTGERMPRRAQPTAHGGWLARIGAMLRDPRTWTTLVYQLLMLPIGTLYFSVAITISALGVGLLGGSVVGVLQSVGADLPSGWRTTGDEVTLAVPLSGIEAFLVAITSLVVGVLLLTALLHLARLVGRFHGKLAKRLLVAA